VVDGGREGKDDARQNCAFVSELRRDAQEGMTILVWE
jgi:hypothetical protein